MRRWHTLLVSCYGEAYMALELGCHLTWQGAGLTGDFGRVGKGQARLQLRVEREADVLQALHLCQHLRPAPMQHERCYSHTQACSTRGNHVSYSTMNGASALPLHPNVS